MIELTSSGFSICGRCFVLAIVLDSIAGLHSIFFCDQIDIRLRFTAENIDAVVDLFQSFVMLHFV